MKSAGSCTCKGTVPVYREYHAPGCPDAGEYDYARWWEDMFDGAVVRSAERMRKAAEDPSPEALGMSKADADALREAFGEENQ